MVYSFSCVQLYHKLTFLHFEHSFKSFVDLKHKPHNFISNFNSCLVGKDIIGDILSGDKLVFVEVFFICC